MKNFKKMIVRVHEYYNYGNVISPIFSDSYFAYAMSHAEAFSHNERLWSHCYGSSRKHCYNPEFLSQFCSLFPFQSLKTVRLRLNLTRQIIEGDLLEK